MGCLNGEIWVNRFVLQHEVFEYELSELADEISQ